MRLTGITQKEVSTELERNEGPFNIINKMSKYVNIDKGVPSFFPTSKAISNLKYRTNMKMCMDSNPIVALHKMKFSPEYSDSIKSIGLSPFHVLYWHKYQQMWYKQYSNSESPCLNMDATGGVIIAPQNIDGSPSKATFLYNIVAVPQGKISKPIGHFISQKHNSNMIAFMLNEMFQYSFKKPSKIVVDDSAALLAASVIVFTTCSTMASYLKKCFAILNDEDTTYPECQIRLDVSHYVKHVMHTPALKTSDTRVKRFYKCCIGLIVNCTSKNELSDIIRHIATVSQNEYLGSDSMNRVLPGENSLLWLKKMILTNESSLNSLVAGDVESEDADKEGDDTEENEITEKEGEMPNAPWLDNIFNSIEISNTKTIHENMYQNITFFNHFKKIIKRVPLWSGVMNNYFQVKDGMPATSAHCESSFNIIKNIIFKNENLPIRADRFVQKHLDAMEGSLRLALASTAGEHENEKRENDFNLMTDENKKLGNY